MIQLCDKPLTPKTKVKSRFLVYIIIIIIIISIIVVVVALSLERQAVSAEAYERSHRKSGRALVQLLMNRLYAPCSLIQPKTQRSSLSQYRLQIPQ